ncbi:competence type IV pilus ATPase ComGA [Streptococcus sp. DD13]|uniref:competence type IV pilus ATPase ComGA n=1 Tax=Streptococcus sp. DD13 TaxID=1777881 RepID=UPI000793A849|nr:competence type IV pilus ATPase ComGA [Streptococcus sp. DD13]KXT77915.1 Late competence protein ComGA, access of DNA to ComEA [Streptococcus sp. DD13]
MVQALAQELIQEAVTKRVSDLYFLPKEGEYHLYGRIREERTWFRKVESATYNALISHFKFLAGMNVGEKRRSQLGSCDYEYGSGHIAMRLSTVADYQNRESMVVRFLYPDLDNLTFWFDQMTDFKPVISGRGLYLFSGPVGSGKTSLMYRLAQECFAERQILTIEDPVEIQQEQMLQLQVNEAIGLTYENLIKLSLRHRPDLLIIGEIRDSKTAQAVLRASLTGLTVFSTIHAKGIPGVYHRMTELGVAPEELDKALQGVFYQRLIAGGGVVDYANENFKDHSPQAWNRKMDRLVEEGRILSSEAATEKIKDQTTA